MKKQHAEAEHEAAVEAARLRAEAWKAICPQLYQDTTAARLPMKPASQIKVMKWKPGPRGIALAGATGTGKTRAIFLLLHRLHLEGRHVTAITAKRFERYVHQMFEKDNDARDMIRRAHRAEILFIDDIGKEKYTERVESEFYDLIETRTANLRPIIWTANTNGEGLTAMMSPDRSAPILRRLREFTEIITL
jgi:DNA replication protein DnaC